MDIVEEAKQELSSKPVAYAEFMLDFKKDANKVYCFFEGYEDRSYYSFRIKSVCYGKEYHDYVCKGKGKLIDLYQLIDNNEVYREGSIGYFVDADFDGITPYSAIYTTPYYSIENFYIVEEAFENILVNEFNISKNCSCFNIAKTLYINLKNNFHEKTLLLNAWLACQSDYRNQNTSSTRLTIDDSLKKVIKNDEFHRIVKPNLTDVDFPIELMTHNGIEAVFDNAPRISKLVIQDKLDEFRKLSGDEIFRGKFELKFLSSFLNRLKEEIANRNSKIFPKKYSTSLRFEYSTSISQLTNNAVTPDCLIKYIQNIK